jgi:hypothetical protein
LVKEDGAPFGFDIVTNQFRPLSFELFKGECGTAIYELQTELRCSGRRLHLITNHINCDSCSSIFSNTLSITISEIKEFTKEGWFNLSQSNNESASAGHDGFFVKALVKLSGSADIEQTHVFFRVQALNILPDEYSCWLESNDLQR